MVQNYVRVYSFPKIEIECSAVLNEIFSNIVLRYIVNFA
jgi:hypothetical protein